MQSNAKRPVSAHHTFRTATGANQESQIRDGGTNIISLWFWWAVLTRELVLNHQWKSKKLPYFISFMNY